MKGSTVTQFAVVTGGTRGIGAGISRYLCNSGYYVAAIYRDNHSMASVLQETLDSGEGKLTVHCVDLTDSAATFALAESLHAEYGAPTILVNNAGSIPRPSYWREQSVQAARETVRSNLDLTMNATWAFVPLMIARGSGCIVNISSTYASLGEAYVLAYTAAKAGLHAMTKGLARDLGPVGITVNTISPAVVETEMTAGAGEAFIQQSRERTPVRRLATPEDVARCVEFLSLNPLVNGIEITLDGGLHLVGP